VARGSGLTLTVSLGAVPLLAHAGKLAQQGCVTGASHRNWTSYSDGIVLPDGLPDWQRHLLTDPQTSGGLLIACAPQRADAILRMIVEAGYPFARRIGYAEAGPAKDYPPTFSVEKSDRSI
jgi:selenide,water dikinase